MWSKVVNKLMCDLLRKHSLLVLMIAILVVSCSQATEVLVTEQVIQGWPEAEPQDVGLDPELLNQAVELIRNGTYENVHGLLVVKDGKLVFEAFFPGYSWDFNGDQFRGELVDFDRESLHNLASVTKSFTSALVGIAINQGYIAGVDEKVFDYFPEYAHLAEGKKSEISIEDLLTMSSGLEWNGMDIHVSTRDTRNDLIQLFLVDDPVEYILAKPQVSDPGTRWYYSGGDTNLLGVIIERATGMRMDHYAEQNLFEPLGIDQFQWDFINPEVVHASGNLELRPRDMAKLGYLYLKAGKWGDQQIVSSEWVQLSTSQQALATWGEGYGYQWWLRTYRAGGKEFDTYYAAGWGGQRITVFPELDMVVVFTGGNYLSPEPVDEIIEKYILPALLEGGG